MRERVIAWLIQFALLLALLGFTWRTLSTRTLK
jgi:hypothetical protein